MIVTQHATRFHPKTHPNTDMTAARRALRRVLSDARFTAAELAEVAGCSLSSIHKASSCVEEASDLSAARWERIARYLCEHGERRVSLAYVSPDCAVCLRGDGEGDGRVDDELRDLLEAGGHISEAHRGRDAGAMSEAVQGLESILARLRAERDIIAR